jgi:antitoxin (DNA-binding transcriptional repressor) of toxin-antitoxin stability system
VLPVRLPPILGLGHGHGRRLAAAPEASAATLPVRSTACYNTGVAEEITQRELRNDSGDIMRRLDAGETFIVTRNGVPVGELTPLRRHRFVAAEAAVALFRTAPAVDYRTFRADLDAVADQSVTPRA